MRLGEVAATFALAQDNAFGQPLESQLRSCLLGVALCEEAGFDQETRDTVYWAALLRYMGCTAHAHEVAIVFGDDIGLLAQTLVLDTADPAEVFQAMVAFATAGRDPEEHEQIVQSLQEGAHAWAVNNFATGCEASDMLVRRLGFGDDVRGALRFTYERWNGNGYPEGAKGDEIPLAMRVVHLSHDMEAIGRRASPAQAIDAARDRRDRTYDPDLADLFAANGMAWFDEVAKVEPWDAVLEREPQPHLTLEGAELDDALTVAADFIDLKSPYRAGHSRRCAQLAADAAEVLGFSDEEITTLRRAALVHELGTTAIPNSILDKPGSLTRAELDSVELHPMLTEQVLRRTPGLAVLNPVAAAHHEKADGSGYHKGLLADAVDRGANVLAAVEIYVGLTTERADRPAFSDQQAAVDLRRSRNGGDARAWRGRCRARGGRTWQGVTAAISSDSASRRTQRSRSRGSEPRGDGADDARDRRTPLHLAEDRRPPHPARVHEDRSIDPSGGCPVGDAERRRSLRA